MVSDYDHKPQGQVPVVVSYTTGQYLDIALTTDKLGHIISAIFSIDSLFHIICFYSN